MKYSSKLDILRSICITNILQSLPTQGNWERRDWSDSKQKWAARNSTGSARSAHRYTLFLLVSTPPIPLVVIEQYPQTASPKEKTAHYSHYLTICFRWNFSWYFWMKKHIDATTHKNQTQQVKLNFNRYFLPIKNWSFASENSQAWFNVILK